MHTHNKIKSLKRTNNIFRKSKKKKKKTIHSENKLAQKIFSEFYPHRKIECS